MVLYTALGGYTFSRLESDNEVNVKADMRQVIISIHAVDIKTCQLGDRRRCSLVVSALSSINAVNRHWARLLLGWVTARGQVNRLGM